MPMLRVLVAISDPDLRRSVAFVLEADGFFPIMAESASALADVHAVILHETLAKQLPRLSGLPGTPVVVLSAASRPDDCPPEWKWLETTHLGRKLSETIRAAIGTAT